MKLVCNACSTKYSIADDKVAGGVFQTPCKRCGSVLIIRGPGYREPSAADAPSTLRNQRNEDSLLFSLNDLAAMADRPATSRRDEDRAEGSGLLDIRQIARSYRTGDDAGSPSSTDSFLSMASVTQMVIDPPLLAPHAPRKSPTLWLLGGATGVAALAVAAVGFMVLRGGAGKDAQASTPAPAPASASLATARTAVPAIPVAPATIPVPAPAPAQLVDQRPPQPSQPAPENRTDTRPAVAARTPEKPRKPTRKPTKPRPRPVDTSDKPDAPVRPDKPQGCLEEVACLLADDPPPCCRKYTSQIESRRPAPVEHVDTSLPEKLGREDIKRGMGQVKARVAACISRSPARGQVTVSVKVAGDGSVASVKVKEAPDSALGSCVADGVRKARFARAQKSVTFSYPFLFR